ncbi:MAG: hypothetical protein IPK53_10760 [bacterium]|nr:hypothetical protein [bacterium]
MIEVKGCWNAEIKKKEACRISWQNAIWLHMGCTTVFILWADSFASYGKKSLTQVVGKKALA